MLHIVKNAVQAIEKNTHQPQPTKTSNLSAKILEWRAKRSSDLFRRSLWLLPVRHYVKRYIFGLTSRQREKIIWNFVCIFPQHWNACIILETDPGAFEAPASPAPDTRNEKSWPSITNYNWTEVRKRKAWLKKKSKIENFPDPRISIIIFKAQWERSEEYLSYGWERYRALA